VTFDDRTGQDQPLNGQYPSGVINWGTGSWYHSGPWGAFTTKSASFTGASLTSATFTFMAPRRLVSLRAYNGGGGATTVTLSCSGQTAQATVGAGQAATLTTGWSSTCTTVTVGSTNGWNTNFDDLVHAGALSALGPSPLAGVGSVAEGAIALGGPGPTVQEATEAGSNRPGEGDAFTADASASEGAGRLPASAACSGSEDSFAEPLLPRTLVLCAGPTTLLRQPTRELTVVR
jgi:hypothetical protein